MLRSVSKGRGRSRGKSPDVMDLLSENQRKELGLIHLALERIERGIFGMCEECAERISEERLLASPWQPNCQACDSELAATQPASELAAPSLEL